MGRIGSIIVPGAKLGLMYVERLLVDVTPETYARFARQGKVVVESNHPAFILGHLSLYPSRIMQNLNRPTGAAAVLGGWEELFKSGVQCQDDPDGKIYPSLEDLKSAYLAGYHAAISAVESAADDLFETPTRADGRLRELFPTVGSAVNFYLIGHVQVHLGQFSAWRRVMGLPAA